MDFFRDHVTSRGTNGISWGTKYCVCHQKAVPLHQILKVIRASYTDVRDGREMVLTYTNAQYDSRPRRSYEFSHCATLSPLDALR